MTPAATVEWVITDHLPSGEYVLNYLSMTDAAGNHSAAYFTGQAGEEAAPYVAIYTRDPDSSPPELDLASINVSAEPTQPEAPNGETRVSVIYVVRDDQSGLGRVSYKLRDPQGIDHNAYHYHENYYTRFFEGDPRAWGIYESSPVSAWAKRRCPMLPTPRLLEITVWCRLGS